MHMSRSSILTIVITSLLVLSFNACEANNSNNNVSQNNTVKNSAAPNNALVNASSPNNQIVSSQSSEMKCTVIATKEQETNRRNSTLANVGSSREMLSVPRDDNGRIIDVLVVYTTKARVHFGSAEALNAAVESGRDQANTSFRNSQIDLEIRIVGVLEIPEFVETDSLDSDLDRIAFNNDGSRTRQLRDQYRADLVSVIRFGGGDDGKAYQLQSPIGPDNFDFDQQRGYSMIRSSCVAQGYYCFTHEIGHNLGAMHESGISGLYNDSRGRCFDLPNDTPDKGNIGTMMAYCGADDRIFYFSNPDVRYEGEATGIADSSNNARAIRDAKVYVANYRKSNP